MFVRGTYPVYSIKDYLNAVTANLILSIGQQSKNHFIEIKFTDAHH